MRAPPLEAARFYLHGLASLYAQHLVPMEEVERLLSRSPLVDLPAGQVVFRQGEPADSALMVITGRLRVAVGTPEGSRVIGAIGAWEVVGETALYAPGQVRSATVTAVNDSYCLTIGQDLLEEGRSSPVVAALEYHLLHALAQRIRATNQALSDVWRDRQPPTVTTIEVH